MGILFNNLNDIDVFASKLGATYFLHPETGEKVYTTYYLKLQEGMASTNPPPPIESFTTSSGCVTVKP